MNRLNLLYPFGVFPGEVLDPAKIAGEFRESARVGGDTGAQNWTRDAFTLDLFSSDCVQMHSKETDSFINILVAGATRPVLPDDAGADNDQWKIPYNQGYIPVGSGISAGPMTVTWVSDVLEMVWIIGTCQYDRSVGVSSGMQPRAQIGLELDGVVVDGTASQGDPPWGQIRGAGMAQLDAAWSGCYPLLLQPGSHTLSLVAGQALATLVSLLDGTDYPDSLSSQVVDRVCIGSRAVYAIRVARGGAL